MTLNRDLMLARLASSYRQGRLVPFLGAGMSIPACTGWEKFITGLEVQAFGVEGTNSPDKNQSDELIRRANTAVRALRLNGEKGFIKAVKIAMEDETYKQIPSQTRALAKIYWPLTLSSNYDELFYRAWNQTHSATSAMLQILGRDPEDCREVLASLHTSRAPILWALQGYIGSLTGPGLREIRRAAAIHKIDSDSYFARLIANSQYQQTLIKDISTARSNKKLELVEQLVVGHEEYRRVTFSAQHFRRAFAEVFRSRSFLFLGSGLSEQYFLNLFGEVLEIFGSSPYPHYALVKEGSADLNFLRSRLNIFAYEYEKHTDLPDILSDLHQTLESHSALMRTWSYSVATSVRSHENRKATDIHIVRGNLPKPQPKECLAVGVRINSEKNPILEKHESSLFRRMHCFEEVQKTRFTTRKKLIRVSNQPVYLFAISKPGERPDLRQFFSAITEVLNKVKSDEFTIVRTKLPFPELKNKASFFTKIFPSLGRIARQVRPDFPIRFWLMELIRAYGQWRRNQGDQGFLELAIHLTDPGVLFDMTTGRIDPVELLMCDDINFTVEIEHDNRIIVSEKYQSRDSVKLQEILDELKIRHGPGGATPDHEWLVEVDPSPTGFPTFKRLDTSRSNSKTLKTSIGELGVVPDCVLRFVFISRSEHTQQGQIKGQAKGARSKTVKKAQSR